MKKISTKQLRKRQLAILLDIHKYCIKNNLRYYLYAGTLLGAIRHNGYIPWDDDIDIAMPRKDYELFIKKYKAINTAVISINNTTSYYLPFAKVIDKNTILEENVDTKLTMGVNVDIFPLDAIPDNRKKASKQMRKVKFWHNLLTIKNMKYKNRKLKKQLLFFVGKIITKPISCKTIINNIDKNATKYNCDTTKRIGLLVTPIYGERTIWNKNNFKEQIKHSFEGSNFYIPNGYDSILKRTYGDYMELPPKEKRVSHHDFIAWDKK